MLVLQSVVDAFFICSFLFGLVLPDPFRWVDAWSNFPEARQTVHLTILTLANKSVHAIVKLVTNIPSPKMDIRKIGLCRCCWNCFQNMFLLKQSQFKAENFSVYF